VYDVSAQYVKLLKVKKVLRKQVKGEG